LVASLVKEVDKTNRDYQGTLEAYRAAKANEKMTQLKYEKQGATPQQEAVLKTAIAATVTESEKRKEMERLYNAAWHELASVKQSVQRLKLSLDHKLTGLQPRFDKAKRRFESKRKAGRRSLETKIDALTRYARAYHQVARRRWEYARRLEKTVRTLSAFEATKDIEQATKDIGQATERLAQAKDDLCAAKVGISKLIKLAKRKGLVVDWKWNEHHQTEVDSDSGTSDDDDDPSQCNRRKKKRIQHDADSEVDGHDCTDDDSDDCTDDDSDDCSDEDSDDDDSDDCSVVNKSKASTRHKGTCDKKDGKSKSTGRKSKGKCRESDSDDESSDSDDESSDSDDSDSGGECKSTRRKGKCKGDSSDSSDDSTSSGSNDSNDDSNDDSASSESSESCDSDDDSSSDSDSDSHSDASRTKKTHCHYNNRNDTANRVRPLDAKPAPTLVDYLTNNPFDFYAKFIKPHIPDPKMANPLELLSMLAPPASSKPMSIPSTWQANTNKSHCRKAGKARKACRK